MFERLNLVFCSLLRKSQNLNGMALVKFHLTNIYMNIGECNIKFHQYFSFMRTFQPRRAASKNSKSKTDLEFYTIDD